MRFIFSRVVMSMILLACIAFLAACFFFVTRLDYVIHHNLYDYGLQFSEEWAIQAWTYKDLTFAFVGGATAVNSFGLLYLSTAKATPFSQKGERSWRRQISGEQLISLSLLIIGTLVLALSIIYYSPTSALVGLGLVFWGAILLYIRTGKLVKETLLDTTVFPSLAALGRMIMELGFVGQAVYLPPMYVTDIESSKAFIAKEKGVKVPSAEHILGKTDSIFLDKLKGIVLEPPGAEITRLMEHILETNFAKADLGYFEQKILPALVEDLEVAQNVEMDRQNKRLRIRLENSSYAELCDEHGHLPKTNTSLGCPLCSAIACILAKTTGKPVLIKKEEASKLDRTIIVEYSLLDNS